MSIHSIDVSPVSSLLTREVVDTLDKEKPAIAVAKLLIALIERATRDLLSGDLRQFDANPGDAACQIQAVKLHELVQSKPTERGIREEAQQLLDEARRVKQIVQARSSPKQRAKCSPAEFFQAHIARFQVSKDMLHLLRAKLLTLTKVVDRIEPNGIIVTKTNEGRLSTLSKTIQTDLGGSLANRFIAAVASQLSAHSVEAIQQLALGTEYEELLSDDCIFQFENPGYPPKSIACILPQFLVILQHLKEKGAVIAINTVVPKGEQSRHYLLKASSEGFAFLSEEDCSALNPELPLIVFEGVARDPDQLQKQVEKVGFENVVLSSAANAPPFHSRSTQRDVKNDRTLELIQQHADRSKEFDMDPSNPLLLLDHVYCVLLKELK